MNINLIGTFLTCKYAALHMRKNELDLDLDNERGVIINVAIAGIEGTIGQAAYSAHKGGIIGMSVPLAGELGQYNIRLLVAPGPIDTGIKMAEYAEKLKKCQLDVLVILRICWGPLNILLKTLI